MYFLLLFSVFELVCFKMARHIVNLALMEELRMSRMEVMSIVVVELVPSIVAVELVLSIVAVVLDSLEMVLRMSRMARFEHSFVVRMKQPINNTRRQKMNRC